MAPGLNAASVVSIHNSTTTALGGGATFTGDVEDVSNYSAVTVRVFCDVVSAVNGLSLESSQDGATNWRNEDVGARALAPGVVHSFSRVINTQFFRLVFENGSAAQSVLEIETIYHTSKSALSPKRLDDTIYHTDDTLTVRIAGDVDTLTNMGQYADQFTVQKFGYNPAFASGVYETVWEKGGLMVWPSTAETVAVIIGGDVKDTAAGDGAREVTVEGLDENFDRVTETIATAGASASSATTTTFTRINRAYVSKVGVYGASNEAAIEIQNTTSDETLAYIVAGQGQTEQAMYTVPAGFTAYMRSIRFSSDSNKFTDIKMCVREGADDIVGDMSPFNVLQQWGSVAGEYDANFSSYIVVPEKSDIEFLAAGAGDITEVNVSFDLLVIKDT